MIAVALTDGLANRMFQYAFGRGMIHHGVDVYYDQFHYMPKDNMTWEAVNLMDAFPNIEMKQVPKWRFNFLQYREWKLWERVFRKLNQFVKFETIVKEPNYFYTPNMESMAKGNKLYVGHWQSERYFSHCMDDIRQQFSFRPFTEVRNIKYADCMAKTNSVAIHVRKGLDYARIDGNDTICTKQYYVDAIEYMRKHVENPVFYVFADNPQWVSENFSFFDYTLVDWNPIKGKFNFRDMQLMSCAKHNIIANSTYSWWGAWLNANNDKIVIAPKKWWAAEKGFYSKNDVVPETWVKM